MTKFRKLVTEIHRRSLWQVLGVYAVASWIIYQVVLALYEGIGLPSWVPGTALVLLLVGLPIVLATAFVQEGAPTLRGDERRATIDGLETTQEAVAAKRHGEEPGNAAESESRRNPDATSPETNTTAHARPRSGTVFTWSKAVTGGVLAFAGLGLAASGFMGMRAMGIGPAATLVSSGVIEAREPILLAEFESASGDSVLAVAVTEALRVDLETSSAVALIQSGRVHDALRRMRLEPGSPLTTTLAREVALREGIRAIVVGEVTAVGQQYVLTARVVGPDGSALASVRETAGGDAVIQAADRLSAALRERLGESFKSIRSTEPLAQVTTPSLDALRKYSQAQRAFDTEPDARKAIVLLREALEYDTAFAMAWRKLGVAYQYVDGDSMQMALERAYRHRDRLTDRERYLTEGTYFDIVENDTARAMLAYETLLDLYPDEPVALNNLGRLHSMRGDIERAAELYARKIEVDPYSATTYRNQAHMLAQLKRPDEAAAVIDAYAERFPDHFQAPQFRGALAAYRFDYDAAIPLFERAVEVSGDGAGQFALISMMFIRGEHARALDRIREDAPRDEVEADLTFNEVMPLAFHRHEPAVALARFERYFTETRLRAMPVERRPWFELGMLRLLTGDIAGAERALEQWREDRPDDFEPLEGQAETFVLEIAAAKGEPDELIRKYSRQADDGCLDCWFQLGRVYEGAGMPDRAIAAYESYLDPPQPPLFRVNVDRWFLPGTLQRVAALHEEAGNAAEAARHYARFVELWQNADPELQPLVEAARRALARLTSEG